MTATDPHHGPAGEEPGSPTPAPASQPALLEQMAGDYTTRITFRDDRTIAGLHILERQTS